MTAAIAARIVHRIQDREKVCYSYNQGNIRRFRNNHRKDVKVIAVICHACRTVINVGDKVASRLSHSATNRAVHYHLACAEDKNIV